MRLILPAIAFVTICLGALAQTRSTEPPPTTDSRYYDQWPGVWHRVDGDRLDSLPTFIVRRGPGNSFLEDWYLVIEGKREQSFGLRSWDSATSTWRLIWVADPDYFQIWDGLKLPDGWYVTREFGEGANAFLSRQAWIPQGAHQYGVRPGEVNQVMRRIGRNSPMVVP